MAALKGKEKQIGLPPQDIEAEMSVLGGVLLENEALNKVLDLLTAEDFYRESHGKLFSAMMELSEHNEPIDLITVRNVLDKRGDLDAVGGMDYLATLVDFVPTAANIGRGSSYAIMKLNRRRRFSNVRTAVLSLGVVSMQILVTTTAPNVGVGGGLKYPIRRKQCLDTT